MSFYQASCLIHTADLSCGAWENVVRNQPDLHETSFANSYHELRLTLLNYWHQPSATWRLLRAFKQSHMLL